MPVTDIGIIESWNEATVSAGAEIASDGALQNKDQRTLKELFGTGTLDLAIWHSLIAASGTMVENVNHLPSPILNTNKPATSNVAVPTWKVGIDESSPFRIKTVLNVKSITQNLTAWQISGFSAAPTAGDTGTRQMVFVPLNTDHYQLIRWKAGSGTENFNGSAWQAGTASVAFTKNEFIALTLISDGTSWQLEFTNQDGTQQFITPAITWADTLALGGGEDALLVLGETRNSLGIGNLYFSSVEAWPTELATTYLTSAQTCESDSYAMDEEFDSDDITVKLGRTPAGATEIKVYVKEDAGAFGAAINVNVTPIAGETGWFKFAAGTTFSSHSAVTLKIELNSPDTSTQLEAIELKIKGITVAGGGQEAATGGFL